MRCAAVEHGDPPSLLRAQTSSSPAMNLRASSRARRVRRSRRPARVSISAAAMQQHDLAGEPPRLAEIVRRHHDLDAARGDGADDVLDRLGGGGIEARGRLVEKQHVRDRAPARAPARAAAARRRTAAAPAAAPRPARPTCCQQLGGACGARRARHAGRRQRVAHVAGGAAPQHDRALEHDGAPRRAPTLRARPR